MGPAPQESAEPAGLAAAAGGGAGHPEIADLADLLLSVARKIIVNTQDHPGVIQLTNLEGLVMRHIDRHPGAAPSQIAADLGLRSSNASAALRSLESKGFITRAADPQDRRAVRVYPTRLAAENLERIRELWSRLLQPHVSGDPAPGDIVRFLSHLDDALNQG